MNLRKLSKRASEAIREAGQSGGLDVSAITVWELAWLATHNRPDITGAADAFSEEITSRTAIRPITAKIAVLANQFPTPYSSDPCDRLIGATPLAEGFALVTKYRTIRDSKQLKTIC